MRVKLFLFFAFILLSCDIFSQKSNTIIKLTYTNKTESNTPDVQYYSVVLQDHNKSVGYFSFKSKEVQIKVDTINGEIVEKRYDNANYVPLNIYKDFEKHQLFFESGKDILIKKNNIYLDSLHSFAWELKGGEKKIDTFLCKRAECFFRGRKYVAWYTKAIPIFNGPWKFGGLPGLILEIQDESKDVYWRIFSIEFSSDKLPVFPEVFYGTFDEYKKTFNEQYQRLRKSLQANSQIDDPSCKGCNGTQFIKFNTIEKLIVE